MNRVLLVVAALLLGLIGPSLVSPNWALAQEEDENDAFWLRVAKLNCQKLTIPLTKDQVKYDIQQSQLTKNYCLAKLIA